MEQHAQTEPRHDRLVRAKELKLRLGIASDTTLWRWIQQGKIPSPKYLNKNRVWREADLYTALLDLISNEAPSTVLSEKESDNA